MKKTASFILIVFTMFFIVACNNSPKPDLFISKYYETYEIANNAIELYNPTEKDIDLGEFKIQIFPNGDTIFEYEIQLEGILSAKEYYLISNSGANDPELLSKVDLKTAQLNFNGNDAIVLLKNDKTYDSIGSIGNSIDFGKDITLIRKDNYFYPQKEYQAYSYIGYAPEVFKYLKNFDYELKSNKDIIDGPVMNEADKELPFVDEENPLLGGGGIIKIKSVEPRDGDTAHFRGEDGELYKLRFAYIDTKEVAGTGSPNGQDWGYPASNFTKNILVKANEIYIQSIKGTAIKDQYDRYLGLVWADGQLVNFLVARAGLTDLNLSEASDEENEMTYKDIPYYSFISNIVARAKANKWSLFGEKDPMWDYDKGVASGTNKTFLPDKREYDEKKDK